MKIGIIGLGIVGTAVKEGMKFLNHEVTIHDLKLKTKIEQVLKTQIIFVCVPTPTKDSGACDTSVVESVVSELITLEYSGVIAIKSTVSIGTTQKLIHKYSNEKICFVPEFLRERCAIEDFIENHDLCVVGTENNTVFDLVNEAHGKLPQKISMATPSEAEAIKYFNNVYNATLITFANSFRDICVHKNVDYDNVKKQAVKRKHINDVYLNSNNDLRGFSGPCLPKDTKEIAKVSEETNITFFKDILKQNSKFKKTVLEGMRDE
jgi:UDPglucose 6-dehydrogenase